MKITQEQLYKRQTTLQEIGEEGQRKLQQTKVVIVGCGGLGSVVAVYLAASGIGNIHLIDYDSVAISNLHRQVFYKTEDINKPKVAVLAEHIESITPFVKVSYTSKAVSKGNVFDLIEAADVVMDCTDSLPIKYLLNDACVLKDIPLIYGSLYKYDGYVASFNVKLSDGKYSANLRDAFPEISQEAIPNCSEIGTMNTIVGIIGLMQANEVLKLVTGIGKPLLDQLLIYNSLENSQFTMKLKLTDDEHSARKLRISKIFEKETYFDANCEVQEETLLISAKALQEELSSPKKRKNFKIISVIENTDTPIPFDVDTKIPFSKLDVTQINKNSNYVIVCNKGISSYAATLRLKEAYPELKVLSLKNGITNYIRAT